MHWRDAVDTLLQPLIQTSRVGLVTDMDGTISHIVDQPDAAQITPRSRDLLQGLGQRLALVAVISGRAVTDVQARVGLPELVYVGNHGLERWINQQVELTPQALQYRPAVEAALHDVRAAVTDGMFIEDKGATISIHYRQTADPASISQQFTPVMQAIADQHGLKFFKGRMVFEIRPPVAIDKGSALRALVNAHQLEAVVFLGDDTTDVDAMRMARQLRQQGACHAVGIGVEAADTPQAVYDNADLIAYGVPDVEAFMDWLLNAVSASSS
jgi:trehalose 6-phosphate phosphatase